MLKEEKKLHCVIRTITWSAKSPPHDTAFKLKFEFQNKTKKIYILRINFYYSSPSPPPPICKFEDTYLSNRTFFFWNFIGWTKTVVMIIQRRSLNPFHKARWLFFLSLPAPCFLHFLCVFPRF